MQKVKKFLTKYFLVLLLACFFFPGVLFSATSQTIKGLDETALETNLSPGDLQTKVGSMVGILLEFVGTIFFLLMIYAGFTWMIAQGDPAKTKKAKDMIFDAIIGLVLVFSAYFITDLIGENVTK